MLEEQDTHKTKDLKTIKDSELQKFENQQPYSLATKTNHHQNLRISFEFDDGIDLLNIQSHRK